MHASSSTHTRTKHDALLQAKDANTGAEPTIQWAPYSQMTEGDPLNNLIEPPKNKVLSTKAKAKDRPLLDLDLAFYATAEPRPLARTRSNSLVRCHSATNALTPTPGMNVTRRTSSVNNLITPSPDSLNVSSVDHFANLLKHARAHTTAKRKADDVDGMKNKNVPSKVPATMASTAARGGAKGKGKAAFARTRSELSYLPKPPEAKIPPSNKAGASKCPAYSKSARHESPLTPATVMSHQTFSSSSSSSPTATTQYISRPVTQSSTASTQYSTWSQTQETKMHPMLANPASASKQKASESISVTRSAPTIQATQAVPQSKARPPALGMRPRTTYAPANKSSDCNARGFKPTVVKHPSPPPEPSSLSPTDTKADSALENEGDTDSDTTYDFDTSFDMETLEDVMKQYE